MVSRLGRALLATALMAASLVGQGCRTRDDARPGPEATLGTSAAALSSDAGPPSPSLGSFVLYATGAVELNAASLVTGCNVGVENANGPFLNGPFSAYLNGQASIQPTQTLYAPSVYMNAGSTTGPIDTNHLTLNGASTHGAVSGFPAAMPSPPAMPPATAGTTAVTVTTGAKTLAPGAYGAVLANAGATITLTGGNYVFSSLTLNSNSSLFVQAATTLSVTGLATVNAGSYLGPAASSGLTAKALVVYLDTTAVFNINANTTVRALIIATNSEVVVNTGSFFGAIAAAQIVVNSGATVTCQDGLGSIGCPASCDDGNPCTTDACGAGACTHTPVANGLACNDGNACTQADTCQSGTCTGAKPVVCAASDQCHAAGTCSPATGVCSSPTLASGTACNDGNACTQADTCQSGTCTGASPVVCAAGDQCHAAGTCSPATGVCSNPALANGVACNDGNACTQADTCQSGTCTGANPVVCAAGDQCHAAGTCSPATGVCSTPPVADGTQCNDGNACTQTDACQTGVCVGSSPVTCAASDGCHVAGACDATTGKCSNPAAANGTTCNDGNACTQTDSCQGGTCTGSNPITCKAADQCHAIGACNASTGVCSSPPVADGTSCNDGNKCDLNDVCKAGACTPGSTVTCTAADQCHLAGTCNPGTGQCSSPAASDGTKCDDGNACTQADSCQTGTCAGGNPITCAAQDQCHVAGSCSPSTGQCTNPAAANGTACDDGNACDRNDSCQSGACAAGSHVTCTAPDACHGAGACNPSTGTCSAPTLTAGFCAIGGACVPAGATNGANTCETCQPDVSTTQYTNVANGTSCSDGNLCDLSDTCVAGACTAGGTVTCTASDACHAAGVCDPSSGACTNPAVADGTSCNDGNACTTTDACVSGACTGTAPVVCTASDQCHVAGTCDPASGACSNPAAGDGTACSDGNACDLDVACKAGACAAAGSVTCAALDACHTAGTCSPSTGVCSNPLKPECPPGLPPDPATIAPPLDPTIVSTVYAQTQFLYTGSLLVQTGVAAGTIDPTRVCELHGRVLQDSGDPASGVVVTVVAHPEYGQTMSRADGKFNIVVNGGAAVTLDFVGQGYLPMERTATCPDQTRVTVPTVVVTPPDPNVTTITSGAPAYQVAKGSVETDADGTRQGVILVPPGTTASAVNACGTTTPLSTMNVRITEYTVGTNGPQRMPASLPVTSAYTYSFETSSDEALAMGASSVQFNQPVAYYNENFLHYPVGTGIPLGTYVHGTSTGKCTSGACSGWVPQSNGIVLAITSVVGGSASIDVTGDGVADSATVLGTFGIADGERQMLAELYPAGKQLWRVQLAHFSAWDSNWGFSPPNDAIAPAVALPTIDVLAKCAAGASGTAVDGPSQTVTQTQPIVGTPYTLVYDSARVPGRSAARSVVIPLTGSQPPADLASVSLQVDAGGNTFTKSFSPSPDQTYTYEWDGVDSFGRPLQGAQPVTVTVGYVYNGVAGVGPYQSMPRFGHTGDGTYITAIPTRQEVTLPQVTALAPPTFDETSVGLGGFTIDVHHSYDPEGDLYLGTGETRTGAQMPSVVVPYAGTGSQPASAPGATLPGAYFCSVGATAVAADGSLYILDTGCPAIYRAAPTGAITLVAGTGKGGYNGDGIAATQAQLGINVQSHIAVSRECDGGFYFSDSGNNRVRYVDGSGIIHTILGNGQSVNAFTAFPDKVPGTQYPLGTSMGVAVSPDGSVYATAAVNCGGCSGRLLRVDTDGIESLVGGGGGSSADNIPVGQSFLGTAGALAFGPDGTLYMTDNARVRQLKPNGILSSLAGTISSNVPHYAADGVPTAVASMFGGGDLAVGPDGTVYVLVASFYTPGQIFAIAPGATTLHTVVGGGALVGGAGNGAPARQVSLSDSGGVPPSNFSLGPDGSFYISAQQLRNSPVASDIRRVQPVVFPGLGAAQFQIPSANGRELYVFDAGGRHLTTLDALTGATRSMFGYDAQGHLATLTDGAGNVTTIQHDAGGHPISVTSPYGQVTTFSTDTNGYLASIVNPNGERVAMTYSSAQRGLLTSITDPAGQATTFAYDAEGRVSQMSTPGGGSVTYVATDATPALSTSSLRHEVSQTTALGVASSYAVQSTTSGETRSATLPGGVQASQTTGLNGATTTTLPSGVQTTVTLGPDPRFGLSAPLPVGITSTSPSGLTFQQRTSSTASLATPTNLFSLTTLTRTVDVDPTSSPNLDYTSTYTAASRTWAMTTAAGRSRTIALDPLARLASSQRGSLTPTVFAYDARGRLASLTQGARARSFEYDANGTLAKVTDPASQVTTFVRDGAGRVTAETLADGSLAGFTYDADGRLASMTTPSGQTHGFTHSSAGLLTSYVAPAAEGTPATTTTYAYDRDGRLTSVTDPDGQAVALAYDPSGRVQALTTPTGAIAVAYDTKTGQVATAAGPEGEEVASAYDGDLTTQLAWSGAATGQVGWTYDKSMKMVAETVTAANVSGISFAYDNDGIMTKAGQMTLTANSAGLVSATALGGVTDAITYDAFGGRATYAAKYGTTPLFSAAYTRDPLGRVQTRAETVQGHTHNYVYAYDARGHLTQVTKDGAITSFAYDSNGNRLSTTQGGATTSATVDPQDRLLTQGTVSYTYDATGELLTRTDSSTGGVTTYGYDALGNLTRVVLPGGRVVAYTLDAAGRRVAKSVDGVLRQQWLYRDSLRPAAELDATGRITTRFVYTDGVVADRSVVEALQERLGLARGTLAVTDPAAATYVIQGGQTLRVVTDALGSPRLLVNSATGAVVASVDYDAFGHVASATGAGIPTLGFAGGLYDPDTNLVHFGARDYDPESGRWTSKDPNKTSGTLNFYQYAGGDPVNERDGDGVAKLSQPAKQRILDSICGPGAQGEVVCVQGVAEAVGEAGVATGGALVGAATDSTTQATSSTDLPSLPGDGNAQASGGWVDLGGASSLPNQPPTVSVSASSLTVTMPATNVALKGSVTTTGPFPVTSVWNQQSGPGPVVFADPYLPGTSATLPQPGVYVLVLTGAVLEYQANATMTVTVQGAPLVEVSGPAEVDLFDAQNPPTAPAFAGRISEALSGRTVSTTWSKVSGPGSVTFSAPTGTVTATTPTVLTTTATFGASGTYVLALTATDGTFTATGSLTTMIGSDEPPAVSTSGNQTLPAPSATVVAASAVGYLGNLPLTYVWSEVSGPAPISFSTPDEATTQLYLPYPGVYVVEITVSDTELAATASLTITVQGSAQQPPQGPVGPAPASPPMIGGLIDDGVVTQPTQVTGTFADALWTLSYRLGGRDDVTTPFTTIASGSGAMAGGVLGTFDPTLLVNGIYTVQLEVSTTGGSATSAVAVAVDGRMKVGNFTLAFTDLDVGLGGLPLQLIRTYDSRVKTVGDFGYGWNLSVRDVRVEKAGKVGAYWQIQDQTPESSFFNYYCLQPAQSASVTITFPSGREYRFTPTPQCSYLEPPDPSDISWTCTSDPDNPTIQLHAAGSTSLQVVNGQLLNLGDNSIWDPRDFTFTNEVGITYQLSQDTGVSQLTDRHGNSLSITPGGIFSSLGPSVPFTRDATGRITAITDPNGKVMTYAYDTDGDLVTYADRAANTTTFTYEGNHYLDEIMDPLGRHPIRCDYDGSGRLLDEIDANGNTQTFTTNLAANQQQIADRLGRVTTYTYNQNGDITQKVDPTGALWSYAIDPYGNVLTSTDPLGNVTTSTYDGARNLLTRTDPLGLTTTYTYNAWRQNQTTTDPLGHTTTNVYDPNTGGLLSTTDAVGSVTTYAYDTDGNRTSTTDPLGNVTAYAYDAAGHMTSMKDPLGRTTSYTYDANGIKLSQTQTRTDSTGTDTLVTSYVYDANEKLLTTTYPDGATRTSTYTATGKLATSSDELGRGTSYAYDTLDRLITTTRPDATTVSQTYDAENQRTTSTDAAGFTTAYHYDGAGRLTLTTHPDTTSTSTTYDAAGRVTGTTDEAGFASLTAYDADGRVTKQTDALGNATTSVYDPAGNQTVTRDPLGHATTTVYDADNRRVGTLYADGTTDAVAYDAAGRMVTKTDPLGHLTAFGYDADGRLVAVTDALGNVTTYGYDEIGERVSQTDANGHVTRFAYDKRGRQTQRTLPDSSVETMTFDLAGEKTARVDFNGKTTNYGYDMLSRLTSRTYPTDATENVSFTYTADGLRATAVDARGTTSYGYDNRRRLTSTTVPGGNQLGYAYDARGLRTGLTATVGTQALTTTTTYDADGRASAVQDPLGRAYAVGYDAASNRTQLGYPNTTATSYAYDVNNRLTTLTTAQSPSGGGAPLTVQGFAYTLDAAGKRTEIVEAGGTVRQYGYDAIDRLTSETVTGALTYAKTFTYDPVGNRTTQVTTGTGAGAVPYTYDARDRMLTSDGSSYTYDANGNELTKSGEATYTSNLESRLTGAAMSNGATVQHAYDADGNRVKTVATSPIPCSGNSATYVRTDSATQGNWQGTYGGDGQYINAEPATPPAYGSLTYDGTRNFTWAATTSDVRGLEAPAPQTSRIASTWYTTSTETFHVVTTDQNEHTIALYFLDWDGTNHTQSVTAKTPSGTALDSNRGFSGYTGGQYAVYTVCGSVDFAVSLTSGASAVVSGVFFGTPGQAPRVTNMLVDSGGGLSQVVEETDGSNSPTALYVRAGDQLLAVMRPGGSGGMWTTHFVHEDGLGSVRTITDETGTVVDTRGYEAFGTKNSEAGSETLAYGFAGEAFDSTANLAYHRARWMDSRVGRFVGMDQVEGHDERPSTLQRYSYVANDPQDERDPSGNDLGGEGGLGGLGGFGSLATLGGTSLFGSFANDIFSIREGDKILTPLGTVYGFVTNRFSLTSRAASALNTIFSTWGFDVSVVDVQKTPFVPGASAYTIGNSVQMNTFVWSNPAATDTLRLALLAHEVTHSVQYRDLGYLKFFTRYFPDYYTSGNYVVPASLYATPLSSLNVDDPRYTLDQLANRVAREVVNRGLVP